MGEHETQGRSLPGYRELPELGLYKDQVVELVNRAVAPFFPREAALTDTMVNNYVKLRVITPPVRKRYNRDQLAQLILVCLLKRVLSIAQLRRLLELVRSGGSTERGYARFCGALEAELTGKPSSGCPEEGREAALIGHAVRAFVCKLAFEELLEREEQC